MSFSFTPTPGPTGGITPPPTGSSSAVPSFGGQISLGERVSATRMGFMQILLIVVFVVMVILALSAAGYMYYLDSEIKNKATIIKNEEAKVKGLKLEEILSASNRIKVINQAFAEHASVSTAFKVLEDSVEHPVTYTRFALTLNPTLKTYDLQLGATAPDYKTIAQQIDTFNGETYKQFVSKVTYDGVNLDSTTGNVNTTFKMPIRIEGKIPESVAFLNKATSTITLPPQMQAGVPVATTSKPTTGSTTTLKLMPSGPASR